jgi:2-polyprenyl-3-methyl-5-hydroxy-6-metoxy-1,4-benzoquinol methylase
MKPNSDKPPGYEAKPADYFELAREEMLAFLPPHCRRVLDVGCSKGNFGKLLKQTRNLEVWGVEPVAAAAAEAATKLDRVIEGVFNAETDLPPESFDAIFFNDVLEHLFDPAAALRHARTLLKPDGVIIASIPNFRHFQTLWKIAVLGEWRYQDCGILDATHLRFFTRKSILELFAETQFTIQKLEGLKPFFSMHPSYTQVWKIYRLFGWLPVTRIQEMRFLQFAVVAGKQNAK